MFVKALLAFLALPGVVGLAVPIAWLFLPRPMPTPVLRGLGDLEQGAIATLRPRLTRCWVCIK
jgi:hypothetical protein